MSQKPETLVPLLLQHYETCSHDPKAALEVALKANQLSEAADKEWLDGAGNLVDKECVVDKLTMHPLI